MHCIDMDDLENLDGFIVGHVMPRIKILKKLDPDKLYLAAELCADFWKYFEGSHTDIGKRVKALSKADKLPIEPDGKTSSNWQLYRLK